MYQSPPKPPLKLHYYLSTLIISFLSSSAFASPAPAISQFDVIAVTSAVYNPVLPNPLTPISVLSMNWDVVTGSSQIKQSNFNHSGSWIAFVTETYGYRVNNIPPTQTYNGVPAIYFGTVNLLDSTGLSMVTTMNTIVMLAIPKQLLAPPPHQLILIKYGLQACMFIKLFITLF